MSNSNKKLHLNFNTYLISYTALIHDIIKGNQGGENKKKKHKKPMTVIGMHHPQKLKGNNNN